MSATSYLEAIRRGLREELARDERVILLGEDIGAYGGAFRVTRGLVEEFGPSRVIDTPVSEDAIVGGAIGAAYNGMIPVCEMQFMDFVSLAFNQLVNSAAKSRYRWGAGVPLTVRGPVGASGSGGPFHSQSPESYFLNVPGLEVVAPATPRDALGLIKSAIRSPDPVLFLEHKHLYRRLEEELSEGEVLVPIGEARTARVGRDLSVVTWGACLHTALDVAEELAPAGIEVEVLDLRSLQPLDEKAVLASVRRTSKLLVLHEACKSGGFGGEVAARVAERAFEFLDAPIRRVAAWDTPVPFAPPLEAAFLPGRERLVAAVRELHEY